ncbi:MAG TPA: dienelactone hydrolase family protein [Gemmatimonadaceae bacterium]|nr:dienelactone hydrolase family protein [Gemmatimonadaceae bacterium]
MRHPSRFLAPSLVTAAAMLAAACARNAANAGAHGHDTMAMPAGAAPAGAAADDSTIAPGAATAAARLARSPRHGEWVTIRTGPQAGDSLRLWVVYPQRSTRAPVVIVVHEIFGLGTWIRSVADQLAADGFIAIAPDFLTGKVAVAPPDTVPAQVATAAIRTLDMDVVQRQIDAAASYGMALPAALPRYGIVGFCWGGSVSFQHAVHSPALGASVVYYGTSPASASLASVRAPVLGLYGGEDARVGATIPPADSAMRALGKEFTHYSFAGAGHGFLRGQDQKNGANLAAAREAWPMTIRFFRTNLER